MSNSETDALMLAAIALRDLAKAATPGPWTRDYTYLVGEVPKGRPGGEVFAQASPSVPHLFTHAQHIANAAFMAAMDPIVGLALADVLDEHADLHSDYDCRFEPCATLAIARALLNVKPVT